MTGVGQSFFTGHQAGSGYAYPNGIFRAITDNPNGASNFFFDGVANGTTNFFVRADGMGYFANSLAIGTSDPQSYKLAVKGSVHAQSVQIDMTGWADYVFNPAYHLKSLSYLKSYIDQNHHLPDMPSEAEVKKNGVDLGEMVKLQTKKIEELTLYLIEKDKQINELDKKAAITDQQQAEITEQKTRIKELEERVNKLTETLEKIK
jgi:predicted transcriptional regulator